MRVSSRGEYGVRAMLDLALHYGQGAAPLKEVAKRQRISESYLEQLLGVLRRADLVKTIRGAQGGYELAREPDRIRMSDVVRAVEGPIAPTDCVVEEGDCDCGHAPHCVARILWARLRDSMIAVLDSITLGDLCREAERVGRGVGAAGAAGVSGSLSSGGVEE